MLAYAATPHLFDTAFGVTVCKRCGRCTQARWRNKLGTHCAPPPRLAAEAAPLSQEADPGGEGVPPPDPPPAVRRRRTKQEVQQMLDSHDLFEVEGRISCRRCGRARRKERRASLGPCPGDMTAVV